MKQRLEDIVDRDDADFEDFADAERPMLRYALEVIADDAGKTALATGKAAYRGALALGKAVLAAPLHLLAGSLPGEVQRSLEKRLSWYNPSIATAASAIVTIPALAVYGGLRIWESTRSFEWTLAYGFIAGIYAVTEGSIRLDVMKREGPVPSLPGWLLWQPVGFAAKGFRAAGSALTDYASHVRDEALRRQKG